MSRRISMSLLMLATLLVGLALPAHAGIGTNGVDLHVNSKITVIGDGNVQVYVQVRNLENTPRRAALYAASFDGSVGGRDTAKHIKFTAVELTLAGNEDRVYTMTINGANLPKTSEVLKDALVLEAGTSAVVARAAQVISISHIPAVGEVYETPVQAAPVTENKAVTSEPAPTKEQSLAVPAPVTQEAAKAPTKTAPAVQAAPAAPIEAVKAPAVNAAPAAPITVAKTAPEAAYKAAPSTAVPLKAAPAAKSAETLTGPADKAVPVAQETVEQAVKQSEQIQKFNAAPRSHTENQNTQTLGVLALLLAGLAWSITTLRMRTGK